MTKTLNKYYGTLSVWMHDEDGQVIGRMAFEDLHEAISYLWKEAEKAETRYPVSMIRSRDNKSLTIDTDGVLSTWEQR